MALLSTLTSMSRSFLGPDGPCHGILHDNNEAAKTHDYQASSRDSLRLLKSIPNNHFRNSSPRAYRHVHAYFIQILNLTCHQHAATRAPPSLCTFPILLPNIPASTALTTPNPSPTTTPLTPTPMRFSLTRAARRTQLRRILTPAALAAHGEPQWSWKRHFQAGLPGVWIARW